MGNKPQQEKDVQGTDTPQQPTTEVVANSVTEQAATTPPPPPTIDEQIGALELEKSKYESNIKKLEEMGVPPMPVLFEDVKRIEAKIASLQNQKKYAGIVDKTKEMAMQAYEAISLADGNYSLSITITVKEGKKEVSVAAKGERSITPKAEGSGAGAGGGTRRGQVTYLNGQKFDSASEALEAAKVIVGAASDYGKGNSAVRALDALVKKHADKLAVTYEAATA